MRKQVEGNKEEEDEWLVKKGDEEDDCKQQGTYRGGEGSEREEELEEV